MPILVLIEKLVHLFCALSSLVMLLPARTTNKTSPNLLEVKLSGTNKMHKKSTVHSLYDYMTLCGRIYHSADMPGLLC